MGYSHIVPLRQKENTLIELRGYYTKEKYLKDDMFSIDVTYLYA